MAYRIFIGFASGDDVYVKNLSRCPVKAGRNIDTVPDLLETSYRIIGPKDGVTSFNESDHKATLDCMKTNYGVKITKMSELINLISK